MNERMVVDFFNASVKPLFIDPLIEDQGSTEPINFY